MSRITRHTPSPAVLISSLALFVALGGTSYAAIVLPKNSVGSAQIKNNAVTSGKVRNNSLLKTDFKLGQLPTGAAGPRGAAGATGAPGAAGAKGDTGAAGSNGAAGANGTNGDDGADGTDGAPGARGPSDAYVTPLFDSEEALLNGELVPTETMIHEMVLPAGDYTIAMSAQVVNTSAGGAIFAICNLREGIDETGTVLGTTGFTAAPNASDARGSLAINGVATIAGGGGSINLSCTGLGSEMLIDGRMIATQVATLTDLTP